VTGTEQIALTTRPGPAKPFHDHHDFLKLENPNSLGDFDYCAGNICYHIWPHSKCCAILKFADFECTVANFSFNNWRRQHGDVCKHRSFNFRHNAKYGIHTNFTDSFSSDSEERSYEYRTIILQRRRSGFLYGFLDSIGGRVFFLCDVNVGLSVDLPLSGTCISHDCTINTNLMITRSAVFQKGSFVLIT
jgi:hypothetical protein